MAIETEDDVINAMKRRRALQRENVGNTIAMAPGTLDSYHREGPSAGHAYAQQWSQGSRAPVDKMAVQNAKSNLLGMMADLSKAGMQKAGAKAAAKGAYAGELAKQDVELFKALLVAHGVDQATAATMGASFNTTVSAIYQNTQDNFTASATSVLGSAGGQAAAAAWDQARELGIRSDSQDASKGWASPETTTALAANLRKYAGNPSMQAAVLSAFDNATRETTGAGLRETLNTGMIPQAVLADKDYILAEFAKNENILGEIHQGTQNAQAELANEAIGHAIKGVRGTNMDTVIAEFKQAKAAMLEGNADGLSSLMDGVAQKSSMAGGPTGADAMDNISRLMDDLDKIGPGSPVNAREAKADIIASDFFKGFKETNGLLDDQLAFRSLNQWFKAKVKERRLADHDALQKAGGASGLRAPAQRASLPATAQKAPGNEGQIVLDKDFVPHRVGAMGELVPMEDAEGKAWVGGASGEEFDAALATGKQMTDPKVINVPMPKLNLGPEADESKSLLGSLAERRRRAMSGQMSQGQ